MKCLRMNNRNSVFRWCACIAIALALTRTERVERGCGSGRASCDAREPASANSTLNCRFGSFSSAQGLQRDRCPQRLENYDNLQYPRQERQAASQLLDAYVPLLPLLNNLVSFRKNQNPCPVPLPMQSKQMTPLFTGQVESANLQIPRYPQGFRTPYFRSLVADLSLGGHLRLRLLLHMPERHQRDLPWRRAPRPLLSVHPVDSPMLSYEAQVVSRGRLKSEITSG